MEGLRLTHADVQVQPLGSAAAYVISEYRLRARVARRSSTWDVEPGSASRFSNTADNVRGRLPGLICEAGFRSVEETRRQATLLGSISLYRAAKPRYPARAPRRRRARKDDLMYPVLFRIGSFEVSSFGVMVALGVLLGLVVIWREMDAAVSMPVAARKRRGSPSSEG